MIERYARPEMLALWSDEEKFHLWLKVELAVCEAWGRLGEIPSSAIQTITKKAGFDSARIGEIENDVKHDVIAFLTCVAEHVGPDARYLHFGMTSSDLIDTAFACQLRDAGKIIDRSLGRLLAVLKEKAFTYKTMPMIGRTHGMHAEPITLGLKFAHWHDECGRQRRRLGRAIDDIAVGKMSGAVGTYAHLSPEIESEVCEALGLQPASASTQVIPRDRHAHFFSVLAGLASSIEKMAIEIRHLQRTEVGEVAEGFGKGQKGSSAMPHKRNPVLSENLTGLARLVRSYAHAALENVALWHERDISHSSVERVIAHDATTLVDFMLHRCTDLMTGLEIFPDRIQAHLEASGGMYASQDLLLALVKAGMTREEAYRLVQGIAMRAGKEQKSFRDLIAADQEIQQRLKPDDLHRAFDLQHHVRHVDALFQRLFKEET